MIKYFTKLTYTLNKLYPKVSFLMAIQRPSSGIKKLQLYKKIKEKDVGHIKDKALNQDVIQKYYKQHRCDGCNSLLQCQDSQKYGYIQQEVLDRAVKENISLISSSYGEKVSNNDSKTIELIQTVQRQLDLKIFNNQSKKLQNLNNVEVLLRLQEKIDKYEEQEQTIRRTKTLRQQIYCYRCYTLKFHNKLPEQYDVAHSLLNHNEEQIMDKVFKKHKELPVLYLFLVDVLDIAGSFRKYVFDRLIKKDVSFVVVVNKLDIVNQKYLNKHLILQQLRKMMIQFIEDRQPNQRFEIKQKISKIKVFLVSNVSKVGIKNLQDHIEKSLIKRIQLVGYPNTGKTTLLNQLAKMNRPTSKVPGTTIFITENAYKKSIIYDMPGLYTESNMYNLINKPNQKSLLAWNKYFSPPIMLNKSFFFGGKVEIKDTKIILFGLGGACSSDNRWFLLNYKQFWKGLPPLHELNMTKYEFDVTFKEGKARDLQIAGWGFISFRLSIPNRKQETRKLTLYLPKSIHFRFRESVLTDSQILTYKSVVQKRFRLERVHQDRQKSVQKQPKHVIG